MMSQTKNLIHVTPPHILPTGGFIRQVVCLYNCETPPVMEWHSNKILQLNEELDIFNFTNSILSNIRLCSRVLLCTLVIVWLTESCSLWKLHGATIMHRPKHMPGWQSSELRAQGSPGAQWASTSLAQTRHIRPRASLSSSSPSVFSLPPFPDSPPSLPLSQSEIWFLFQCEPFCTISWSIVT